MIPETTTAIENLYRKILIFCDRYHGYCFGCDLQREFTGGCPYMREIRLTQQEYNLMENK